MLSRWCKRRDLNNAARPRKLARIADQVTAYVKKPRPAFGSFTKTPDHTSRQFRLGKDPSTSQAAESKRFCQTARHHKLVTEGVYRMVRHPIYTAMLPESALHVMGVPHPSGRAAMKMLEREGFAYDGYIDIFDGGPTMSTRTDNVRTIRESRELTLSEISDDIDSEPQMLAAGRLHDFAAGYGNVSVNGDGSAAVDAASAKLLGIKPGDSFLAMGR